MTTIKSSGIACKGNINKEYEMIPNSLFTYVELELISAKDFLVYQVLLKNYNKEYGYSYPTLEQLLLMSGVSSKTTVLKCLKNLESVGLIKKGKVKGYTNNVYFVYKPLEQRDLYGCVPDKVKNYEEKKQKISVIVEQDKVRLQEHKEAKESEKEIEATKIVPSGTVDLTEDIPFTEFVKRYKESVLA